jgi:hypothetical protein
MNEKDGGRRPKWGLLLLIPATVILAKAARQRRAMWNSNWCPSETVGRGYGRHPRFGGGYPEDDSRGAFRLPPKIERMLDAWHAGAHQTTESAEPLTT